MAVVQSMEARAEAGASAASRPPAAAASGSSFYAAMRILPPAQRDAMFEIYAFCRQVDDIADEPGPIDGRRQALDQWRTDLDLVYRAPDAAPPAHLAGLARAIRRYELEQADFLAVIDGMEMDVVATIVAPTTEVLDLYCDRVASAVGRLSVKVFGMPRDDGLALSHHLGRALQLTNILRDIDEDAGIGRVYLPREGLLAAGVALTPEAVGAATLDTVCAPLLAQAREHLAAAQVIIDRSAPRAVVAPALMARAYAPILDKLARRGFTPPRQPVRRSKWQKAKLVLLLLRYRCFA